MKKWLLSFSMITLLTACSTSNESKQIANDSYEKRGVTPTFTKLETGGVKILGQDNRYQLPTANVSKTTGMDIRPPSTPLAIIGHSIAQFDGERSSIIYPAEKRAIYNLQQIQRLLTEKNIGYKTTGNQIHTDWTSTGRADDLENTQIRYLIEEVGNQNASGLVVSVEEMKRNEVIFTPTTKDKERYSSDRLNQLVGELNASYRTQQQQVATEHVEQSAVQSAIVTDHNQHLALAMNINFNQAWVKLEQALPQLGFETKEQIAGKGYRVLKYTPLEATEWARFGVQAPELEKGEYYMQLNSYGNESAVVISNSDKDALNEKGQSIYQALQQILAK